MIDDKMEKGRRMQMHPAWQAAHELLADPEKWWQTMDMGAGGYSAAQIVTAMRCMGYGDDIVVTALECGRAVAWQLPPVWIPEDHNNTLDAYPGLLAMLNTVALEEALLAFANLKAGALLALANLKVE